MDKYAIIGYPLGHTFSPQIHNPAFKELGINAEYGIIPIDPESFDDEIIQLKKGNFKGFNITVPYKQKIIPFIDIIDPLAQKVGSVNTIQKKDNLWYGYNTDIFGFIKPIKKLIITFSKVLVIGAGGAANAVCSSLLQYENIKSLTILNRSQDKAQNLKERLEDNKEAEIIAGCLDDKTSVQFDIIINTTNVGMGSLIHINPFDVNHSHHSKTVVYDLIYNPEKTLFLKQAEVLGLQIINGLEMLIGQAAKSFTIWTGKNYPNEILNKDMFYKKS